MWYSSPTENPTKGTFHTSFVPTPGQDNWIGIYDADGKTLIDEVVIPASLLPGQTWARTEDGIESRTHRLPTTIISRPSANIIKDTNSKIELFAERDENGFGMTIMAMVIVFSALLLLCLCFCNGIGKTGSFARLNKSRALGVETSGEPVAVCTTPAKKSPQSQWHSMSICSRHREHRPHHQQGQACLLALGSKNLRSARVPTTAKLSNTFHHRKQ